jgi:hypothetical protein
VGILLPVNVPVRRARYVSRVTRCLVTVEDTFALEGRGLVLTPSLADAETLRGAVELEARRPAATKEDVPVGSQLWTVE